MAHADHCVHRGADLVAHVGQEVRLHSGGILRAGAGNLQFVFVFAQSRVGLLQLYGALSHARLQHFFVALKCFDQLVLRRQGLGCSLFALQELPRHRKRQQKCQQRLECGKPSGQQGLVLDLGIARIAQHG